MNVMKKFSFFGLCAVLGAGISMCLEGCISIGSSPAARFYALDRVAVDREKAQELSGLPDGAVIGVGPVTIPAYLDRPQIVTRDKQGRLIFAQFDRWGESLDDALERLINEKLAEMFPRATIESFPWNFFISAQYQVIAEVVQWDARLDEDLLVVVQWSVLDLKSKDAVHTTRSVFKQPIEPHTYDGLADALRRAMTSLVREMADAVVMAAQKSGK